MTNPFQQHLIEHAQDAIENRGPDMFPFPVPHGLKTGWGKLVETSPGDAADGKWLLTEYIYDPVAADWEEAAHPPGYDAFEFAYEINGSTSNSAGDLVQFWEGITKAGDLCLFFGASGGKVHWAITNQHWVNVADNGSYVPSHHCDDRTGLVGEDASDTFNIYLPRCGTRQDPNVEDEWVIPYIIDTNGDRIAVFDYLDGTIAKSIQIWDGAIADLATDKPGWAIRTTGKGTFPVIYDAEDTDYDELHEAGGYTWHGQTENNHTDHNTEHTHTITSTLCPYAISGTVFPAEAGTTSAASWSDANHGKHYGPSNSGDDTDNRPEFTTHLFLIRADNSEAAP